MNILLAYMMQEQVLLMLANDNTSMKYTTARVKMNAHAPHGTSNEPIVEFQIDRGTLFDALTLIMREMASWTYVKPFAKKCNEGSAITVLYNHCLGPNNFNDPPWLWRMFSIRQPTEEE
jgi:hypothetical protein